MGTIFFVLSLSGSTYYFNRLNTKEFIQSLAEKLGISQKEATELLGKTTRIMREMITEEEKLGISGLGTFQVKKTTSREAYLPALDKKALVPPRHSVQFHPSETLKEKLKNRTQP